MEVGKSNDPSLCARVMDNPMFLRSLQKYKDSAKAYSEYLRTYMHFWLSEVFHYPKGRGAFYFLGGALRLKEHAVFRVLWKLYLDEQILPIVKCREKMGFPAYFKNSHEWQDWSDYADSLIHRVEFTGLISIPDCLILTHVHHLSCGKSCLLDEQHLQLREKGLRWEAQHVILAMILLDYEGITTLFNGPLNLDLIYQFTRSEKELSTLMKVMESVAWYTAVKAEHIQCIAQRRSLLEIHDFLSTLAVFPEKERRVWANIRRVLEERIPGHIVGAERIPGHIVGAWVRPGPRKRLPRCAAPDMTEQEMETLREEMDEHVDHLLDIYQDAMADNPGRI